MKVGGLQLHPLSRSWRSSCWIAASLWIGLHAINQVRAADVYYNWTLDTELDNALSPDCMNILESRRYLFLAEESLPGPTIDVNQGDTVHLRVTNNHEASGVSLHFHGIHQYGTPYVDGPVGITQCELGPMQTQEYVFTANPPGTHLWHSHATYSTADGVAGAFIVRPVVPEPFQYDEEQIIFLQDWYIETGAQQVTGLLSSPFVWIGNPNTILINGKGIAGECQEGGVNFNSSFFCLPSCQGDPLALLSTITVEPGKTYRFRIINSAQLVMLNLAIANHTMTIVQVEGTNVVPVNVSSLDIAPGQRYDVLLTADQTSGSYWIETTVRAREIPDAVGHAILHYDVGDGSNATLPDVFPSHPAWNQTSFGEAQDDSLKTLDVTAYPEQVALNATDVQRFILVGTQNKYRDEDRGDRDFLRWALNNVSHVSGTVPLIGQIVDAVHSSESLESIPTLTMLGATPPFVWNYTLPLQSDGGPGEYIGQLGESVIPFKEGDIFEFVLQNALALNTVAEFHPWHSHGHSFWVVGRGRGVYDPTVDVATYNLVNPVLRDTVTLQPLNWVALRFVANNPGAWFFHCHILAHEKMGMSLVIVTSPEMLDDPPDSVRFCNDQSLLIRTDEGGNGNGTTNTTGGSGAHELLGSLFLSTVSIVSLIVLIF